MSWTTATFAWPMRKGLDKIRAAIRAGFAFDGRIQCIAKAGIPVPVTRSSQGYDRVSLRVPELGRRNVFFLVHTLIAYEKFGSRAFREGMEIRHLDDNKRNNEWTNIGYGTHLQNYRDFSVAKRKAITRKRIAHQIGRANCNRKLSTSDVLRAKLALNGPRGSITALATQLRVSRATIYRAAREYV